MNVAHQERPSLIQPPYTMDPSLPVERNSNGGPSYPTPTSTTHTTLPAISQSPPEQLEPVSCTENGRTYKLEVVQQPIRARMCGFGDKDRRPITPPPCIRLIVQDTATGKDVDISEIDTAFFVLSVDLWSADSKREVNLVRHSATSPSISAATSCSYPPRPSTPPAQTNGTYSAPNSAHPMGMQNTAWHHQHQLPPQQSPTQANGGPYGHTNNVYHNWRAPGPLPTAQPQYAPPQQQYYPQQQFPPQPQAQGYYPPPANTALSYYPQPQQQGPLLTPDQMQPQAGQPATGMFTRNLIGSLSVSAFKLTDPESQMGVWFILQDLSVRTEGTFRLKMNFVSVARPNSTHTLNTGSAPILASCYSDVFQVYSAKKFPGVIESTALSKCFATQGIKIPIRKDGPRGNVRDREEFEEDLNGD